MNDATTPQSRTTLILMAALAVLLAIVWILGMSHVITLPMVLVWIIPFFTLVVGALVILWASGFFNQ